MTEAEIIAENKAITAEYRNLLRISYQSLTEDDKKLIRLAFDTAVEAHKDQRRNSGEAYIFHPIAVAKIVASEIGLDAESIAAALLHDVVEDTDYTIEDMERLFGKNIARIVEGLTKISKLNADTDVSLQAENFRKLLLTLNEDIRVIIIKIADRLHNMQTMDSMRADKQVKIASETLYIYAPLAHRIGLYNIKTELEDLSLKYTAPEEYNAIHEKIVESKEEQQEYIEKFNNSLHKRLKEEQIEYEIKGRSKSIYSIRKKMNKQGVTFEEVYDKFAVRIIYDCEKDVEKFYAWKIYTIVTDNYHPNPTRLRDWISSPKSTGYEALHITVMGLDGKWVEVQIRSQRMNEIAEKGYAAHYKYKQGDEKETGLDISLAKLQEAIENPDLNAIDFVQNFKLNLDSREVYVFTPTGELKQLEKKATALDFAFCIHTKIGLRTKGAKVNGKLVPLSTQLKTGDQVEIITSDSIRPSKSWLEYTQTSRAKTKIKTALNEHVKLLAEEGKELLRRKFKQLKLPFTDKNQHQLSTYLGYKTTRELYHQSGLGNIPNKELREFVSSRNSLINFFKKKIIRQKNGSNPKKQTTNKSRLLVFGTNDEKLDYKISTCCKPVAGDSVFGFVTVSDGIKIHKNSCPNAISLQANYAYRVMTAKWVDTTQEAFKAVIQIIGYDTMGIMNKITNVISKLHQVDMKNMNFQTKDGTFVGEITISISNKKVIEELIKNLKKLKGIDNVRRL